MSKKEISKTRNAQADENHLQHSLLRIRSNERMKKPGLKLNSNILNMTQGGKIIGNHNFQNNYQSLCGTLGPNHTIKNLQVTSRDRSTEEVNQLQQSHTAEVRVGNGIPKTTTAASLRNYTNIRNAQHFDFGKGQIKPANNSKPSYLNSSGSLVGKA